MYLEANRRSRSRSQVSGRPPSGAARRRSYTPVCERLEDRQLLAAAAIAAIEQYSIPSVFAIDGSGNLSYNFLTINSLGQASWNGWSQISGGIVTAISPGKVLVNGLLRPNIFLLNSADNIYYNYETVRGNWNGWSPVGVNVGATAISSGLIPLTNAPYVFLINTAGSVYYNYQTTGGAWAGWSAVGVNVGASAISTGVLQVSSSPAYFEPYVFMLNGANDVYYKIRNTNGTWSNWSPVGVGVGAAAISAVSLSNRPYVSMLNGAGGIYVNFGLGNGAWAGWSPVGIGSGSGATPAIEMESIGSDFSMNDFAVNPAGQVYSTFGNYGTWSAWFPVGSLPPGVERHAHLHDVRLHDRAIRLRDRHGRQRLLHRTDELGDVGSVDQSGHSQLGFVKSSECHPLPAGKTNAARRRNCRRRAVSFSVYRSACDCVMIERCRAIVPL